MISIQCCYSRIPFSPQKSSRSWPSQHPGYPISPFLFCQWRSSNSGGTQKAKGIGNGSSDSDPVGENAIVQEEEEQDMEGYLQSLSLEFDDVWDTKPSWCQPWTISLTGISIIAVSWVSLNSVAVTCAAAALVGLWWYIFLYSYPKAYSEMIAGRRDRVRRGLEDAYGAEIKQ